MSTIKRSELDAAVAVEVMWWKRPTYSDGSVSRHGWSKDDTGKTHFAVFNPSTDLNHAFEALERWKDGGTPRHYEISRVADNDADVTLQEIGEVAWYIVAMGEHESLAIAICLALLSAVRGEQVELEDE